MDYNKLEKIKRIQRDIINETYRYFNHCDRVFKDYIYGDPYYQTLKERIYSFLVKWRLDYSIDLQTLKAFDILQLVSDLYLVFIRADIKYKELEVRHTNRHRKNYIHRALRTETWRLLYKQYKRYVELRKELTDIDEILKSNLKQFRYVSFEVFEDDSFIDQLSYDRWVSETEAFRDSEAKRNIVREMMTVLNSLESEVIEMTLDGFIYTEMAGKLKLTTEQIRKIFHRAKIKLVNYYNQN